MHKNDCPEKSFWFKRWPPVCRGGEPVGRLAPAGPLDTSGARTIVSSRRSQRSAQVEGGRARACRDPSRPLGLMRPPSAPPTPAIRLD